MRVYTDVLQVSLKRFGEGRRYQFLNIIVSVLVHENSNFILAAHPYFYPDTEKHTPSFEDLVDSGQYGLNDDWDCLDHPGKIELDLDEYLDDNDNEDGDEDKEDDEDKDEDKDKEDDEDLPDISRGGYFICSPYAEAAHFLVVQKMLSRLNRFEKVYHYIDAAWELYSAALCALTEPVRAGRVEIACFNTTNGSVRKVMSPLISNSIQTMKSGVAGVGFQGYGGAF